VPGNNTTTATFITLGSHKDDVIRIQGTPTKIEEFLGTDRWYYGDNITRIEFSAADDTVTAWDNYNGSLILQ